MTEDPDNPDSQEEVDKEPFNVLVVDEDKKTRQLLADLLKKNDIPEENIHLTESILEATAILMKRIMLDAKQRIHLLISDVRVPEEKNATEFIELAREHEENRPYIAAISEYSATTPLTDFADEFLQKPDEIDIERLAEVIKDAKELIEEQREKEALVLAQLQADEEVGLDQEEAISPKPIRALLVDEDSETRKVLSSSLSKHNKIPEENIFAANNNEEAFNLFMELMKTNHCIDLVLLSDLQARKGIEEWAARIKQVPEEFRPIVSPASENSKHITVKEMVEAKKTREYLKEHQPTEQPEEATPDEEKIVSPELLLKKECVEEGIDLARGVRNRVIALFDLDGTLSVRFTVARWVKHLDNEKIGDDRSREKLLQMMTDYEDGKYGKGYYPFIEESGTLYGQMLTGQKVEPIREMGEEWSLKDAPLHLMKYSVPLIQLARDLGIEPTLVTGTPIEAIQGFRHALGIRDRCYALEADHKDGIYTGTIKYNTGLPDTKSGLVRKLAEDANHQIILGAGDQGSDSPLIKGALEVQKWNRRNDICGTGILIDVPHSVWNEYRSHHADAIRDLRLKKFHSSTETTAFLTAVLEALRRVVLDPSNKGIESIYALAQRIKKYEIDLMEKEIGGKD